MAMKEKKQRLGSDPLAAIMSVDRGGGEGRHDVNIISGDFELTDRDFDTIRNLVLRHTGINLTPAKRQLVYSRLGKRLRQLGMSTFSEYCDLIQGDEADSELTNFINQITTNLTSFYREPHHFDILKNKVLPELMRIKSRSDDQKIRIWSAGCSTGEEPYTIAMTVMDSVPRPSYVPVKILATDLDTNVLEKAAGGIYSDDRVKDLPREIVSKWFMRGKGTNAGVVRVSETLRNMITFRQLNLMESWPMKHKMDVIFCRNVVIYFDKKTQEKLFYRYANIMADGGYLFIGHSESLHRVTDRFESLGGTVYRKLS